MELTHLDEKGAARMVDVGEKHMTRRTAQAQAVERLKPLLTGEEADILRRGRNAHVGHVPKNASVAEYHAATGLEALFGYLYLCGNLQRLQVLFEALEEA